MKANLFLYDFKNKITEEMETEDPVQDQEDEDGDPGILKIEGEKLNWWSEKNAIVLSSYECPTL